MKVFRRVNAQVLHPVSEVPMLCHVIRAVQEVEHSRLVLVVSPQSGAAIQQASGASLLLYNIADRHFQGYHDMARRLCMKL